MLKYIILIYSQTALFSKKLQKSIAGSIKIGIYDHYIYYFIHWHNTNAFLVSLPTMHWLFTARQQTYRISNA